MLTIDSEKQASTTKNSDALVSGVVYTTNGSATLITHVAFTFQTLVQNSFFAVSLFLVSVLLIFSLFMTNIGQLCIWPPTYVHYEEKVTANLNGRA